ncbi:UNVERIFIED_CONTAM: hypothetical protein K2H54_056966 [Gekko kuhli]
MQTGSCTGPSGSWAVQGSVLGLTAAAQPKICTGPGKAKLGMPAQPGNCIGHDATSSAGQESHQGTGGGDAHPGVSLGADLLLEDMMGMDPEHTW